MAAGNGTPVAPGGPRPSGSQDNLRLPQRGPANLQRSSPTLALSLVYVLLYVVLLASLSTPVDGEF